MVANTRDEFLKLSLKDLRPAAEIPKMLTAVAKLTTENLISSSGRYKHKKSNGEIIDVQLHGNIISVNGNNAELVIITDITILLRAQENNFISLERLRDAQKIARIGYWSRNLNEDVSHRCWEMYSIYGRSPESFIPTHQNLINCFHTDDRYLLSEEALAKLTKNPKTDFEHRIITEHGEVRWLFKRLELQLGHDGTATAIKGVVQDITEKKKTDEKFKAIFDQISDAIILGNRDGNFLDLNAAALMLLGYTREESTGYTSYEIFQKISTGSQNVIWDQFKARKANSGKTEIRRKDSSVIIITFNFRPDILPGVDLCVITDITDSVQKQNQLLASERRFKALVQEGADLIGILDLDGNYKFVSENSYQILGLRPFEFIGKNVFDFIHLGDREEIKGQFSKLLKTKQVRISPFRFRDSKGNWRWIRTVAHRSQNGDVLRFHGMGCNERKYRHDLVFGNNGRGADLCRNVQLLHRNYFTAAPLVLRTACVGRVLGTTSIARRRLGDRAWNRIVTADMHQRRYPYSGYQEHNSYKEDRCALEDVHQVETNGYFDNNVGNQ